MKIEVNDKGVRMVKFDSPADVDLKVKFLEKLAELEPLREECIKADKEHDEACKRLHMLQAKLELWKMENSDAVWNSIHNELAKLPELEGTEFEVRFDFNTKEFSLEEPEQVKRSPISELLAKAVERFQARVHEDEGPRQDDHDTVDKN